MTDPVKDLTVYLVGGAVRDQLLGLSVQDRDWVVIGTTPNQMIRRGFKPVGKDFPVFLHPETGEEYALARTERKVAPGYRGFECISDPEVTLEQDLERRDLSINAMAIAADGTLVDPWGGQDDIAAAILRHVSAAFAEDPVRILRAARFAARFAERGFTVAEETNTLMRAMVDAGEVDALVPERVWQELQSALAHGGLSRFIQVLRDCGALAIILPEVEALFGVAQPAEHHPEIDTGLHIQLSLDAADGDGLGPREQFAVLVHDLGKALTPKSELPKHIGHERRGLDPLNAICDRLRVPNDFRRLALHVCEFHLQLHRFEELKAVTRLKLLESIDAFRHPDELSAFARCCAADLRGRTGSEQADYPQAVLLEKSFAAAKAVDTAKIAADSVSQGKGGASIGEAIRRQRVSAIKALMAN